MIRELVELGKAALAGDAAEVLEALVAPIEKVGKPPKGHQRLLAIFDLAATPPSLHVSTEVLDGERARRYLWLGNPRANDPKVRVTTNRLDYLLGQTFYAFLQDEEAPVEIAERLRRVFPALFWTDTGVSGGDRKYAHLLDAKRLGLVDETDWNALLAQSPKDRAARLAELLLNHFNLPKKGVLFTLAIDGEPLALTPQYRRYLLQKIVGEAFEEAERGRCHACGKEAQVTGNFKHFQLKFFINDKVNFAYGLNEQSWPKSYGLCQRCYEYALVGERYLIGHFQTRLLQSETLIVPTLGPESIDRAELDELSELLLATTRELERVEALPRLLNRLGESNDLPQINLLFLERSQSATKIKEVVPEVEPSWILRLLRTLGEVNQRTRELFGPPPWGDRGEWLGGVVALLYLLPLEVRQKRPEVGPALRALKSLLIQEPQVESSWVRGFLTVLRFLHHQNPGIYASKGCPDGCPDVEVAVSQMAAWLLFLKLAGLLEEVAMEENRPTNHTHAEALHALGLGDEKAALYLLGVLLARVASEQYKRSKSKPVLEKVGYQGMPLEKVRRFAVELFDKLGEYRRLDTDSEATFATAMELLTAKEESWGLTDEENAFYILLGYGLETRRIINFGAAKKKGEEA
ncbi:TM1802 family CRISPR-associated protein [Oceanithermus sp.]